VRGGLCSEINFVGGHVAKYILKKIVQQSIPEGGCIVKYILKALYGELHSLCGVCSGIHSKELDSAVHFEGAT
jgi:hypothetical protein